MALFTYTSTSTIYVDDLSTNHGTIDVYGTSGLVEGVSIELQRFYHKYPNDFDMLLVAPDGLHNLAFMSDTGGSKSAYVDSLQFSDTAAATLVDAAQGAYLPTDNGVQETADNWGLSIPVINHPASATFASAFGGILGNGDWSLYIHDDSANDTGHVDQWKLTVTTKKTSARLEGSDSDDLIRVIDTGYDLTSTAYKKGLFVINERGTVAFEGVSDVYVLAGAGNDLIVTGNTMDAVEGGSGRDTIHTGAGDDYINVGDGDDAAGEIYDGGSGSDTLLHMGYATLDLRDDTLQSIEGLWFFSGGKTQVTADQSGDLARVQGASDLTHPDVLEVTMGKSTDVNLSGIKFIFFDHAGDMVRIKGDGDAETIQGTEVNDYISAAGGNDVIVATLGRDIIDGGKGSDTVDYSMRSVAVKVTLKGSDEAKVKVDGLVEDTIRKIENVRGGSAGDVLTGDKNDNSLFGFDGADKLKGGAGNDKLVGGSGADTMSGGSGKDQFVFSSALDAVDHIKDFSHADDTIVLDNVVFAAFAKDGAIKAKHFVANASGHEAHTAKQKLIFDKTDHSLWYDADGNGAGAAVEIAIFDNKINNLDYHDFLIV